MINPVSQEPHQLHHHSPVRGEQALWRAVITQALMDASSQSKKVELQYEKSQAACWLAGFSEDFRTVCEFADYDPNYVRENSLKALERNCQWRAAPQDRKATQAEPVTRYTAKGHFAPSMATQARVIPTSCTTPAAPNATSLHQAHLAYRQNPTPQVDLLV